MVSGGADRLLVTFFVTGFNQQDTIAAALEGALAQTWRPLELIFSDDASSDGTFEIMRRTAEANRVRETEGLGVRAIQAERNGGIVGNVNRVMAEARGEFVIMAGGDDVSEPERAERLARAWLATGRRAHLVHSAARTIDAAGNVIGMRPGSRAVIGDPTALSVLRGRRTALGAAMGWSRALFETFGPIPAEALVEDVLITLRAAFLGPLVYLEEPLVRWRVGGVSWTGRESPRDAALYGTGLAFDRWRAAAMRCALADLTRVTVPDHAACVAEARRQADLLGLRVALADASRAGRAALVPRAAALAARHRTLAPLRRAGAYLFEDAYLRRRGRTATVEGTT